MKITVYVTTNCQYSKQEKEYLTSKSLPFEEKNLDTNKEFLTEMMTVGNNFAGTPVTKIEKDDGTIVVLKGFTKEEFDTALGFAPEVKPEEAKPQEEKAVPAQEQPQAETPTEAPVPPTVEATPPVPQPTETPAAPTTPPNPQEAALNDVLNQLQGKANDAQPSAPQAPSAIPTVESPAPAETVPPTTPPTADSAPAIPDFPADAATQPAK